MTRHCDVRSEHIWLGEDGVVRTRMSPNVHEIELSDAQEVIQAIAAMCEGVRRPVLVDTSELRSMSRDCRKFFAGSETARVQAAVGILIKSPLARAMGNFYLVLNKPLTPTRLFTTEADALAWLREFVP